MSLPGQGFNPIGPYDAAPVTFVLPLPVSEESWPGGPGFQSQIKLEEGRKGVYD